MCKSTAVSGAFIRDVRKARVTKEDDAMLL
jgi:hypothetical protein